MKKMILSLMTSGFSPEKNAITRILLKVNGEDRVFDEYISLYDREYDEVASEKTGLDKMFLLENGISLKDGLFGLRKFIFDSCGTKYSNRPLLIGYNNIDFDVSFLRESGLDVNELFKFKVLDLYPIVFGLDYMGFFEKRDIRLKDHKLQNVCRELGICAEEDRMFDKIKAIEGLYSWLKEKL